MAELTIPLKTSEMRVALLKIWDAAVDLLAMGEKIRHLQQ
jgi:hypothetical protein